MHIEKKAFPVITSFSLKNKINTNPDYQRPAVWSKAQKQQLIDTIIRGYDIPKFYLKQTDENCYDVIDGQQRLRAIWGFLDNEYPLDKKYSGDELGGKYYRDLINFPNTLTNIQTYNLDWVVITNTDPNDDEIKDLFLRLQNGSPLKAQEKRNAMPGKMRDFVCELSENIFFSKVNFKDSRYAYQHVAAQMMCLAIAENQNSHDKVTNVKDKDLNTMYTSNTDFDKNSKVAKSVIATLKYMHSMFPAQGTIPELQRVNIIPLFVLIHDLVNNYDMKDKETEIGQWFINFERNRNENDLKDEEDQDPELVVYHGKMSSSSDGEESISWRYKYLKSDLLTHFQNLKQTDPQRSFDETQRKIIYRKFNGICQMCGKLCEWGDYEADHIIPWNRGGQTCIENGQVLCASCNSKKHDNL